LVLTANVISDNGSPVTGYEWKLGGTTIGNSANLSYAVATADNGKALTLSVTNICGTTTTTGVTVTVPAALTQGNPTAATICSGATNAFTLAAATGGSGTLTYQWQSSANGTTWTDISGATSANYTTPALTANTYYRRQATRTTCGGTISSASALVTVTPAMTQGNPTAATICSGATNTFTLAAPTGGSGTISYNWQQSADNSTWANATGTRNAANYTTPALTSNMYYRRQATAATCGGTITSNAALVTVTAALTQGNPTAGTASCGGTYAFTLAAATGGSGTLTYQWQSSTDNSTWTNISGATSANYTTPALFANTYYRRQATRATCGGTVTSASALVTAGKSGTATIGTHSYSIYCYGGSAGTWMVQNSQEGTAAFSSGANKYYSSAQLANACVSPWVLPPLGQVTGLRDYLRSATTSEQNMWTNSSSFVGYYDGGVLNTPSDHQYWGVSANLELYVSTATGFSMVPVGEFTYQAMPVRCVRSL
jgi:hypothetical protein